MITIRRLTALGPAIATTGAALGGPTVNFEIPAGLKVAAITARLRTRLMSAPIQNGSVLVQAAVVESATMNITSPSSGSDALENGTALWAGARYVSTAQGARFMPGIVSNPVESLAVVVRVWNRDDLDDTRRITVDVAVILCGADEDVGGVESGHPLGLFTEGTGTMRRVSGAEPAATVEASITQPVGVVWVPQGAHTQLLSDATGTLTVRLKVLRSSAIVALMPENATQAVSQTVDHFWGVFLSTAVAANFFYAYPMVFMRTIGGDVFTTDTLTLGGTDNYTALSLMVEEWVVPEVTAS